MTTMDDRELIQLVTLAHDKFSVFLTLVWNHLGLPAPTKVQREIANYLQYGGDNVIIHAQRGEGKSWITAAYVLWLLWNNPKLNILVVSASGSKAFEFSTFTRRILGEMPLLRHLTPGADQRDSVQAWDVSGSGASQAPSVKSVGITGQITGSRADVVIADDIETLSNSLTVDQREKLLYLVTEFVSVLKPGGKTRFLGTPQSIETIYRVLAKRGYLPRYWPSRVPDIGEIDIYDGALAPEIMALVEAGGHTGEPTDPERFSDAVLRDKELQMGRSNYLLQFQLNTSLSDLNRYPLKTSDLLVMALNDKSAPSQVQWASIRDCQLKDIPCIGLSGDRWYTPVYRSPTMEPYSGTVMAIDSSGRGSDLTGYAVVKQLNGNLFLMDCGGFAGGYEGKTLEALANKAKQYDVNEVIVEANFGDGMFTHLLEPVLGRIHPCTVTEVKNSKQKELRIIDTLEPLMNSHRLIVDQSFVEKEAYGAIASESGEDELVHNLFYQMTRITKERGALKHDDKLDALAMACGYWVEAVAQDAERRAMEFADQQAMEELERFCDHIRSGKAWSNFDETKSDDRDTSSGRFF